jgi:diaminopimelate decarboxylase/aspartate kinase
MQQDHYDVWWARKRAALLEIAEDHLNAYVYDLETVEAATRSILALKSVQRVLYAVKANFNAEVLQRIAATGGDFDCVSPGEVRHLQEAIPALDRKRILFTPNFAPRQEYAWAIDEGIQLTLDNLYPLQQWPELFTGQKLLIRLDPGQGQGHHQHVRTAGTQSKFGVSRSEIDVLVDLVNRSKATVIGIHAHIGSGILDPGNWQAVAAELVKVAERFPAVRILDLGGGFGVPEKRGEAPFDLAALDATLIEFKLRNPQYELWLEPGRLLVSAAGVLLAHVTQTKTKGDTGYVGVSTGINSLIRPALYDAYHDIVNLSRLDDEATQVVSVVGPICESGDRFGTNRMLPVSQENDVILIANVGAYGQVMSSRYNLRDVPPEITI